MRNTRGNIFLQSMKTNTLSVKKLMKNLILRTLRQLYAVSKIIILIRWVMPPQKVENLQFEFFFIFEIPQLFNFFNFALSSLFPSFFFIGYINTYMSLCPLQHSLIAMSSCWIFWTKWMWSDPNLSMLSISNSISPSHMHSIETVECLLCVLVSRRYRDKH